MFNTMRSQYTAPFMRAFKQAPWRSQTQAVAILSVTLLTVAVVGGFYLAVAARAATAGRDLQAFEVARPCWPRTTTGCASNWPGCAR